MQETDLLPRGGDAIIMVLLVQIVADVLQQFHVLALVIDPQENKNDVEPEYSADQQAELDDDGTEQFGQGLEGRTG